MEGVTPDDGGAATAADAGAERPAPDTEDDVVPLADAGSASIDANTGGDGGGPSDSGRPVSDIVPTVWWQNFESFASGRSLPYTLIDNEVRDLFGSRVSPEHAANITLIADPDGAGHGVSASVIHYIGQVAIGNRDPAPGYEPMTPSGFQSIKRLGTTYEELYVAYSVYIPADFVFPLSIKGNMLISDTLVAYNSRDEPERLGTQVSAAFGGFRGATATEFNTRPDAIVDGTFGVNTLYGAGISSPHSWYGTLDDPTDPPTRPNEADRAYASFRKGQWNRVVGHVRLNDVSPTVANGRCRAWLNGELVVDKSGIRWRDDDIGDPTIGFSRHLTVPWYGGHAARNAAPQTQSLVFDDLAVSEEPLL